MKRTLFYELCASLLLAALLAGFNLLAEPPSSFGDEVAVMPAALNIVLTEHRGGRGAHRRRGHRRPRRHHAPPAGQQGGSAPNATPSPATPAPAAPAAPAPQPATPPAAQ